MENIHHKIFTFNRNPEISDWFSKQLEQHISSGVYHEKITELAESLIDSLADYRTQYQVNNVFVGMSGGIDSAVTAALFMRAGYRVYGVVMPIQQNPEETARGLEACEALGLTTIHCELTDEYLDILARKTQTDPGISVHEHKSAVRRGNIRARLRMINLYDLASKHGGLVASTDNFSELAAGFWTLHGDVGDVAPIQSLSKSWEVPALAEHLGVPQSIIDAVPTDGLGIANGDEDQFGFSYLEFDIALFSLLQDKVVLDDLSDADKRVVESVMERVRRTTYKRANPFNLSHPFYSDRFDRLSDLDKNLRS